VTPAEADHLRRIETARLTALVNGDMDVAEQLHGVDSPTDHSASIAFSKTEYLHAVATRELHYSVFGATASIDVWGDEQIALIRYRARIGFHESPGDPIECWQTDCYRSNDGNWQQCGHRRRSCAPTEPDRLVLGNRLVELGGRRARRR
jgi:hypothetical protein